MVRIHHCIFNGFWVQFYMKTRRNIMADNKIKAFFKGILKADTVTKSDFDKAMKEKYDCKNPVLLKAFQKADGFDELVTENAIVFGKCLQYLTKGMKEIKITQATLNKAIHMCEEFDTDVADGFIYAKDGILRAVITTWTHGDKLAECVGWTKEQYEKHCRDMNKLYVKVPVNKDNTRV